MTEIKSGYGDKGITPNPGYVYDDQHPNGRPSGSEHLRQVFEDLWTTKPTTLYEYMEETRQRLDRIENLLVTILGHVEPELPDAFRDKD